MTKTIIYILLSLWGAFTTYLLFEAFYDTKDIKSKVKWILFGFYFLATTIVYIKINIPIINLVTNLIIFFIISFNYKTNIKKSVISIALICIILISGESLSSMLLSYGNRFIIEGGIDTPLENLFFGKLITFLIVIAVGKYINLKKEGNISYKNLAIIITISLISMYVIMLILSINSISLLWKAIGILGMVIINLAVVYLYSSILDHLQEQFDKSLYQKELEYTKNQFNILKNSTESIRILHHDINNHLSSINLMLSSNKIELAKEYIDNITTEYNIKSNIVNTGNIVIDSIVNAKIPKMDKLTIAYKLNIFVPEDLKLNSSLMTSIISNALDNAIEALSSLEEEKRWLNLTIGYNKKKIVIIVENPYQGVINKDDDNILTSKKDKANHGLGLKSISSAISKENGLISIKTDNNIFKIKIMM